MTKPPVHPYYAPPQDERVVESIPTPEWPEDARQIQEEAGLGSYGGTALPEQAAREDAFLGALEPLRHELAHQRFLIRALCTSLLILLVGEFIMAVVLCLR